LDYVRHYPKNIRTEALGILSLPELRELVANGLIKEVRTTDYSGFHYIEYSIDESHLQDVDRRLEEEFYPTFTRAKIDLMLQSLYQELPNECHTAYSRFREYGYVTDWTLENSSSWQKFLLRMSELGLGYLVHYSTSNRYSRSRYSEFYFRSTPIDIGEAFCENVESVLKQMTEAEAWVLYVAEQLRSNDLDLIKRNRRGLLPLEIEGACKKFVIAGPTSPMTKVASLRVREYIGEIFPSLCARDTEFLPRFCTILTVASRQDGRFLLARQKIDLLTSWNRDIPYYIDVCKESGIGLIDASGNLVIPELVKKILEERLSGIYSKTILIDNRAKALEALEDILHRTNADVLDPYMSYSTLDRICRYTPERATIRILSSVLTETYSNEDTSRLESDVGEFQRRNRDISCKVIWYPPEEEGTDVKAFFHDRYIFLPETAWQLGASINYLGSKLTTIHELRRDLKEHLHSMFRHYWNTPEEVLCRIYPGVKAKRIPARGK